MVIITGVLVLAKKYTIIRRTEQENRYSIIEESIVEIRGKEVERYQSVK